MPSLASSSLIDWLSPGGSSSSSVSPLLVLTLAILVGLAILAILYPDRPIGVAPHAPGINHWKGYPLVGSLDWILSVSHGGNRLLDEIFLMQKTEGMGAGGQPMSVTFPALGGRVTVINNPRYLEWVQKTNFDNYPKGPDFHRCMSDVLGPHGIFVADGAPWFQQRKLASHIFSRSFFSSHVQDTMKAEVVKLDKLLLDASDGKCKGEKIQFPDLMFRFTLSTFAFLAFNAEVDVLPDNVDGLQKVNEFGRDFDFAQTVLDHRFVSVLPKWTEWFTKEGHQMRKTINGLHNYCYRIIDSRLERKKAGGEMSGTKAGKDLLELFIDQGISREELLPVLLNFIVAGRDTTAQSLAWFFYEMWKHPEHIAKIRQTLVPVLGAPNEQRPMDFEDYKELPYLHACFYEAIRLWPAVPKNAKRVLKDDIIQPSASKDASGDSLNLPPVPVRKGESVLWSDWAMARMPEIWGEDCEDFKPERFLETDGGGKMKVVEVSQWKFHAFNGGPRLCLGKLLATYEGMAVIAAILGRYDVVFDSEDLQRNPPTYQDSLTLPCSPYWVQFEKRQDI
ncbi:cytochrome P450 [Microstroma glucosiphilum]|uniref:Cytochrome P450 n=1 Tax=Pseudomicrostroma glucosiphilum TaxID=1684307 RepID=A0A316UA71_9BASI|nr:cytochrome P450 [Pseudomicrostroma glucosiphilum]PWN22059.1 cytochrome P450 [Pseudomicrostroma glucosiphilum]